MHGTLFIVWYVASGLNGWLLPWDTAMSTAASASARASSVSSRLAKRLLCSCRRHKPNQKDHKTKKAKHKTKPKHKQARKHNKQGTNTKQPKQQGGDSGEWENSQDGFQKHRALVLPLSPRDKREATHIPGGTDMPPL